MYKPFIREAGQLVALLALLLCAGCATTGGAYDEGEPAYVAEEPAAEEQAPAEEEPTPSLAEEGEVPIVVAQTEHPLDISAMDEIVVAATRHEVIHDLVSEAQSLLQDVKLEY